ncbi:EmrB/QacA subfamily drug resistance transporter [Kibdelosporangium banguiense]|uniref:EmrB/QacA subfamily drug resistance transporter n=1 Tax=Kibdelosporangium banguiense TaxID=1365924 RepID=A0ABS4TDP2_9PSEU|nr:MFS transporter [Kibdelosporangium banguiense]MBP2322530.1 EmrB/QacA subfamily drug resistance transporter [Kibdelosporangium banguiense]
MGKWSPLIAVCLGGFVLLVDVTIVTVALPEMARSLSASFTGLQWVIDAYALALAALVLASGSLADHIGRRKTYIGGLVVFAGASLACGLAESTEVLVISRAVQGIGGAAMLATTMALVNLTYHGKDRSVALAIWGAVSGAAAAAGPVLGGVLTEYLGWRWIFLVNIPIAVIAVWMTLRVVAESSNPSAKGVDIPGVVTFTAGAAALTYGLMQAGDHGWGSARTLGWIGGGVLAWVIFAVIEARSTNAMLDLALFRKPSFSVTLLAALAFTFAAFAYTPFMSVWLQQQLGMKPLNAGLAMIPMSLTAFVIAGVAGRFMHSVPFRYTIGLGMLVVGAGALLLKTGDSWTVILPGLVVVGVGVAVTAQALPGAIMASVPLYRAGMASGALNTFRQLGMALGVAVLGTVVSHGQTFDKGLDTSYVVAGISGVAVGLIALMLLKASGDAGHDPKVEQVLGTKS